jgi:GNAT superfamily N-acetyltransferase
VAFAVSDALQGHGIGTRLLEYLARLARVQGLSSSEAYVMPGNQRMLDVFRESGFEVASTVRDGVVHVLISLAATPRYEDLQLRLGRQQGGGVG